MKQEIIDKFTTNFLDKTPADQITPEGLVESLTEILNFDPSTVAALQTTEAPVLDRLTLEYPAEIQEFLEQNSGKLMLFHLLEDEGDEGEGPIGDLPFPTQTFTPGMYFVTQSTEVIDEEGNTFTFFQFNSFAGESNEITIDSALSTSSNNPVQNRVINNKFFLEEVNRKNHNFIIPQTGIWERTTFRSSDTEVPSDLTGVVFDRRVMLISSNLTGNPILSPSRYILINFNQFDGRQIAIKSLFERGIPLHFNLYLNIDSTFSQGTVSNLGLGIANGYLSNENDVTSSFTNLPTGWKAFSTNGFVTGFLNERDESSTLNAAISATPVLENIKLNETSLSVQNNILSYDRGNGVIDTVDLSLYLDDTNLARIISGVASTNGFVTFTRDDNTTFSINMSSFLGASNINGLSDAISNDSTDTLFLGQGTGSTSNGGESVGIGHNSSTFSRKSQNTAIGNDTLTRDGGVAGFGNNVAIGYRSINNSGNSNITGNIGVGAFSHENTAASGNIGIGTRAFRNATDGNNIGIGNGSSENISGNQNIAIGASSCIREEGSFNIAIGTNARVEGTGQNNVNIGFGSGFSLEGEESIGVGRGTLARVEGSNNVSIGNHEVLEYHYGQVFEIEFSDITINASPGVHNVNIPSHGLGVAGTTFEIFNYNPDSIFIGIWGDQVLTFTVVDDNTLSTTNFPFNDPGSTTELRVRELYENTVALGNDSRVTKSNQVVLGNLETEEVLSNGKYKGSGFEITAIQTPPASATDTGSAGEIRFTSTGVYICVADNTWIKTQLETGWTN